MGDIDRMFETGRAAWPGLRLARATFEAHVAALATADVHEPQAVRAADLYLACAAGHGDAPAVEAVERTCLARAVPALTLMITASEIDDVMQVLRQRLFIGTDRRPRILAYAGRGELRAWVRASAVRTAFEHLRRLKRERAREVDLVFGLPRLAEDPVLDQVRRRFQGEFCAAFQAAIATLDARQRTLLRQHFLDGVNTEQLGALYRVHRATAFRWLRDARARLLRQVRAELVSRLGVGRDELDSLLRLVDSRFEVSAERVLAAE